MSLLLPTNHEIRGLIGSQKGANIHTSVPLSVQVPPTNLYTLVVDFIHSCWLVESPLYARDIRLVFAERVTFHFEKS